ncbi:T9SS C-terminal target domain-containing protein [Foetidibacter luteolus]|uniref:T9SS C-terminal target domain-containing protein n=1 Tax=Foetidibacter luteolus TaxID=2608880 RepID=UPI00129A6872|nr:T9SS C-terminal target domain-containing protein [Foetidibacter luteolus]
MKSLHTYHFSFVFSAFVVTVMALPQHAVSQVYGCTDSAATNYNPAATANNGSCIYNAVEYIPPVKVDRLSDTLIETSGLQMAGNFLWSFNDGGGAAAIYRVDSITGRILQTVYLKGASNVDWEDIAFYNGYFYIGDFGNNATGARTDLKIYRFPLSAIPANFKNNPVVYVPASKISTIKFTYANQPQPPQKSSPNNTQFDCEAMLIDSGRIHLFTKNWVEQNTTHYVIKGISAGTYKAQPVETLATGYLVTGADKSPYQKLVVLLGYQVSGTGRHFMHLLYGYTGTRYFSGNKRKIDLPDVLTMGQAEGICFNGDAYGYISNERFERTVGPIHLDVPPRVHYFNITPYVTGIKATYVFTGNGDWELAGNWVNSQPPVATPGSNTQVIIDPLPGGQCILHTPFTIAAGCELLVKPGKHFVIH